jgi:hypothetical protein
MPNVTRNESNVEAPILPLPANANAWIHCIFEFDSNGTDIGDLQDKKHALQSISTDVGI